MSFQYPNTHTELFLSTVYLIRSCYYPSRHSRTYCYGISANVLSKPWQIFLKPLAANCLFTGGLSLYIHTLFPYCFTANCQFGRVLSLSWQLSFTARLACIFLPEYSCYLKRHPELICFQLSNLVLCFHFPARQFSLFSCQLSFCQCPSTITADILGCFTGNWQ